MFPTCFGGTHRELTYLRTGPWLQVLAWDTSSSHFVVQGKMTSGHGNSEEIQYPHSDSQPPPIPPFLTSQNINKNPQALICQQPLRSGILGSESSRVPAPNLGASYLLLVINPPSSLRLTSSEARFLGRLFH